MLAYLITMNITRAPEPTVATQAGAAGFVLVALALRCAS
jgi:hypothetical protein